MTELTTAWMLGCVCGFFMGVTVVRPLRDRDPDWRRSFNHENRNRPTGPPPLKPSSIPKPQRSGGYQPLSQGAPTNPPPRNP
jgi:hypothetical protein